MALGTGCPIHGLSLCRDCIYCCGMAMQNGAAMQQNHVTDSLVYIGNAASNHVAISSNQGSISIGQLQAQNPKPFFPNKPKMNKKLLLLGR
jgi:hypothetical protein